jgi:secreted trypsin-like serine protease
MTLSNVKLHTGMDACTGDSGSPLFTIVKGEGVVVGITSWGVGCGRARR